MVSNFITSIKQKQTKQKKTMKNVYHTFSKLFCIYTISPTHKLARSISQVLQQGLYTRLIWDRLFIPKTSFSQSLQTAAAHLTSTLQTLSDLNNTIFLGPVYQQEQEHLQWIKWENRWRLKMSKSSLRHLVPVWHLLCQRLLHTIVIYTLI